MNIGPEDRHKPRARRFQQTYIPQDDTRKRIEKVYLTNEGYLESQKWCIPGRDKTIAILTVNSPPEISIYDQDAQLLGTYERQQAE